MNKILHVGLDVGSTTVKIVALDDELNEVYSSYQRHNSDTKNTVCNVLEDLANKYSDYEYTIALTGSGAMSAATFLDLPFIQEVVSCKNAVKKYIPQTDVVIELGGEDAKIIYFGKSIEQRMNGTCAGGTGAFIDQMASLLNTDASGLNELAKNYKTIYPIASRCGVFAKTDVQPLINDGALKEDIAVSIFQAVVNQTISGLACGRPIRGKVAFLGGPLNYLSELKDRFIKTLNLKDDDVVFAQNSHLLVANGAALSSLENKPIICAKLLGKISALKASHDSTTNPLKPLFITDQDYLDFKNRHSKDVVKKFPLKDYSGNCFLGIDAGSTTTKICLIDSEGRLLHSSYGSNEGNPLESVKSMLKDLYKKLPKDVHIRLSGVTGYGEELIKTALNVDIGEIETIAHYTAAKEFLPEVSSIVDIGGQDMKYINIKNGAITNIQLNEACSSGCGSFLETFSKSLSLPIESFVQSALESRNPVDLGSRCTVFMNSKIKQSQKEGYTVGDISAGLSYSIVKNALQKVMKIHDYSTLGDNIVVQGGTFYNDAVLRAFELLVGKNVIRPDIAGLMGAYGIALIAKEQFESNLDMEYHSTILSAEDMEKLSIKTTHTRCGGCENHCLLTINVFNNGARHVSGNRCEKGAGLVNKNKDLPNLVKYKYNRVFDYTPLDEDKAYRGTIGIPRVLNMYEDYPFWFTFFTNLGFRVILSDKTTRKTYETGMESMPSESVCYPAKLAHGHIMNLLEKGITTIFYPCIPYSRKEYDKADNSYNCPIVISYSEVIKNNVEELKSDKIKFINPFLPFAQKELVKTILCNDIFDEYKFNKSELMNAAKLAEEEYKHFKNDIYSEGEKALKYIKDNDLKGIVLAGRPYHVDPEINHGIDSLITTLGLAVITGDSISHKSVAKFPLRVVNQWAYHSRLYAAADFVGKNENLELVQLNSFGCGVDAVTTDQVNEILASYNKMYTLIKIDEVNNLGAIKIRLRSLLASMNKRIKESKNALSDGNYAITKLPFTKENRKNYTILMPQMSPVHFDILEAAMLSSGYNFELLKDCDEETVETGLKFVNNDACYPSLLVTGQMIKALESGKYDPNKTALIISQTGGGCRATNYIGFIRKALIDAGYPQVPVISFNVVGLEKQEGFKLTIPMAKKLIKSVLYGDMLQKMLLKNRPYEVYKGETLAKYNKWMEICKGSVESSSLKDMKKIVYEMVEDFEKIKLDTSITKPKVGIVGEILIKYHPFGNNDIVKKLEADGSEVVLPDFMGFVKFCATSKITNYELLKIDKYSSKINRVFLKLINYIESDEKKALASSKKNYLPPSNIFELENNVKDILSIGNQTGEGWFLTAEMIEYIKHGINNIVCVQPFACLPNHVVGKGVIKTIRDKYPEANISAIDYDPGASETNQTNRIKLLTSIAKDNIQENKLVTK